MQFAGLFFARDPLKLGKAMGAPCHVLGRHALCAEACASDGGAIACACGRMRNGRALGEALARAGMRFDAALGASALVLGAYRLWGEEFARYIEGPISCAVIDQDAGRLLLSRDRMGERSVFYAVKGTSVAFADSAAALLEMPGAPRSVDLTGLRELFALGPARTPGLTPVAGMRELQPGCVLAADAREQRVTRYFALEAREHEEDERETVAHTRYLIKRALDEAMPMEPGAMLSGGLDSTYLSFLAAQAGKLETWSVGYEDDAAYFVQNDYQHERDEPFIRMALAHIGGEHHQVTLSQEALAGALREAMIARGLPGMADVDASLLLLARDIAPRKRAVLSGECADEVFGGYPWFHRPQLLALDGFPWSGDMALRESVLRPDLAKKLDLTGYAAQRYHESAAGMPRLAGERAREARLRQLHGLCLAWFMPVLQERARAMCGAAGVAVLTPYCDERLAEYVFNVPWSMKNMGGRPKGLLREAARGLLPEALLERPKSPYPKTHHPAYARAVCERMRELLARGGAPICDLLDGEKLTELMEHSMAASAAPWFGQLMTGPQMIAYLLQVNDFLEKYALEVEA